MTRTDRASRSGTGSHPAEHGSRRAISVALLAGVAFLPIVVAVGFLVDRSGTVPGDISVAALRGAMDGLPDAARIGVPARAGY